MATKHWRPYATVGENDVVIELYGELVPDPNAPPEVPNALRFNAEQYRVTNNTNVPIDCEVFLPRSGVPPVEVITIAIPAGEYLTGPITEGISGVSFRVL